MERLAKRMTERERQNMNEQSKEREVKSKHVFVLCTETCLEYVGYAKRNTLVELA